ncbi:MAG: outer membrane lipoprotein-sorting protein [Desulfobacterales bacterium]|nr:MAG: outer membrane lipoprotein-sorting protein [Desulfobacterales bacterium]
MLKRTLIISWMTLFAILLESNCTRAEDAATIVEKSFNYMRGIASIATVIMTIHRPDWERKMTIKAWTRGQKDSLFYIDSPPKDHGNGTLKRGREMWIYNPKINRVIKVPPSMMSQSWMGSDFSNNDLAKSDSLLTDYTHLVSGSETHEGKRVYLIKSMPKPNAPVVWGMQKLKIREDLVWLSEEFYDEDLQPVKVMTTLEIQMLGGKLYPKVWRMRKVDEIDKYTELTYTSLEFKSSLPDSLFTQASLRKARR